VRHPIVLAALIALGLAGCPSSSSTPATVIQPAAPTVGEAEGRRGGDEPPSIAACTGGRHDLMVVDWAVEQRADLEAAMTAGVVGVAYDCRALRVLPGCGVDGSYGYVGVTRRDKTIAMATKDEIAANLPVGGLTWLSDVGVKLGRDRALEARLTLVGKRSAGRRGATRAELPDGCDDATHVVRAASVGAFSVATVAAAELGGSAKVAGKGATAASRAETRTLSADGDLEACAAAKPDATAPPDQCGAIVRIELEPLGGDAAATQACPPGFAVADGACRRPDDAPHQCDPADPRACDAQCERGHAGSCTSLAAALHAGAGIDKDWGRAILVWRRACDAGELVACRDLGRATVAGEGIKKDAAAGVALLDQACLGGDGAACVDQGAALLARKATAEQAQYAFRRACYGGEPDGCRALGDLYAKGKGGLGKNPKIAAKFYERGCKDGVMAACTGLADAYRTGKGMAKDPTRAKALYVDACDRGHAPACKHR
jgi:uncharacterized protein